jgi:hypothetical protein
MAVRYVGVGKQPDFTTPLLIQHGNDAEKEQRRGQRTRSRLNQPSLSQSDAHSTPR